MKSVEYWKRRAERRIYESLEKSEKAAGIIALVYAKAAKYLKKMAEGIFGRYQDLEGLTEAEAMLLLQSLSNKNDIDELIRKLETEDMKEAERLTKNTAAYLARLRRLKKLFEYMNNVMESVYKQERKVIDGVLAEIADDGYLKTMFDIQQRIDIGFSVDHIDQKRLDTILNMDWSGKHYSERIWENTQRLGEAVEEQMLEAALTGKSEDKIAVEIEKEFGKGAANARRLVRTESAYVAGEVNAAAYEDAEIEQYIFLATLDLKTSETCRKMDGKRFKCTDKKTGENYPPLHPFCRSTTISFIEEEYLENMKRTMRNPVTDRNEKVPLTMTYEEWHKKYVEGNAVAEAKEKSLKNKSADKKQYQKYKEVLGEENAVVKNENVSETVKNSIESKNKQEQSHLKDIENNLEYDKIRLEEIAKMDFEDIPNGSLSDTEARMWYIYHDKEIPDMIDRSKSIEDQARQAFDLRNLNRTRTRDLMKDQEKRKQLDANEPNWEFEELIEDKMKRKTITREEAIIDILLTATKTRKSVNKELGLE